MIIILFIGMLVIQCFVAGQQLIGIPQQLENGPVKNNPTKATNTHPVFDLKVLNDISKPHDKDIVNVLQSHIEKANENVSKKTLPEDKPHPTESKKTLPEDKPHPAESESNTLTNAVIVLVVLTMILFLFLGVRVFRAPRNSNVIVKKYGVRARRCDVEMEPLPLDDEEDETIFELGNSTRH